MDYPKRVRPVMLSRINKKNVASQFRLNTSKKFVLAISLGILVTLFGGHAPAFAYDGNQAANYADSYATSSNRNQYIDMRDWGKDDCTNFVSQALHAGGFSFVNKTSNWQDDANWYFNKLPWWQWYLQPKYHATFSRSWVNAPDLYSFLIQDSPGGWSWGTASGTSSGSSGVYKGDLLFYDWGQGQGISHVSIQVASGGDTYYSGWYGDLVDAHQSDRWHAIWSLDPENAFASSTTVYKMHIDPNNH